MNQHNYTKRELQLLERHQNSNHKYRYVPLKVGFNQKRVFKYDHIKIHKTNNDLVELTKAQNDITKEIKQLDSILRSKHHSFRYHFGFLYRQGISQELLQHFTKLINTQSDTVEYGFAIWRLHDQEGIIHLVSGRVGPSVSQFKAIITDKSIQKLQSYNQKKHQQSLKYEKLPWKYFSKGEAKRIRTEGDQRERKNPATLKQSKIIDKSSVYRKYTQGDKNSSSIGISSSFLSASLERKQRKKSIYQELYSFRSKPTQSNVLQFKDFSPSPSKDQLCKMLLKQNRIFSVWTPPTNYPQLLLVMSVQIREKQVGIRAAWIGKYYCLRHCLSKRLFNSMIDWLSFQFGSIQELHLVTTKCLFDSVFLALGWRLVIWINDEKVRITYKKNIV